MHSRTYLVSLPERVIRSALGLSAGLLREVGEVMLPRGVRSSHLYKSLVDTTLRYLIEQVGGAEGVYPAEQPQPDDFLARRGAGNAIELLGIVAFRVSPVWVLAALADLSGLGRRLIPEIAEVLREQGLLEKETQFHSMDQLLDGLEKTSSRLAETIATRCRRTAEGVGGDSQPSARSKSNRAPVSKSDRRPMGGTQARGDAGGTVGLRDVVGDGGFCRAGAPR